MYTALRNTKNKGVYLKSDFKKEWRIPGASIRDFKEDELEKALFWTKTKKIKTIKDLKNTKTIKTIENIKTTVALSHSEYELMLRILEEDGITITENLNVVDIIDAINYDISYKEEEDSWAYDLDWNTQLFLHCQGALDLCGGSSDTSAERSLLNKFKPLHRKNINVLVDIILKR